MKKQEYLMRSIENGNYRKRQWLLLTLGILDKHSQLPEDMDLTFIRPGVLGVSIDEAVVEIEDYKVDAPLYGINERISLPVGTLGMVDEVTETTYGVLLMNVILLYYPYQGKVKYLNKQFKPGLLNSIAYEMLKSGKATIEEHIRFENAASFITCLTQVAVPSASRKSITPNDAIRKRRDELLKENKDRLHDPAVVSNIQKELAAMDKEALKDDPSAGFFIKDKSFSVTRLRTMGMYGAEPNFQDETKIDLMTPSLTEGWDVDNLPMLINTLRSGSYSRGKETAMGGESTKITTRIFQNYNVVGEDCGTVLGMRIIVTPENIQIYEGRYLVGGKAPLSVSDLTGMIGKEVMLRSPIHCIQGDTDLCATCVGRAVADSSVGLNAQAVAATSAFMDIFMQKTHGRALQTERYDYQNRLS